jgi:hypothetical protein
MVASSTDTVSNGTSEYWAILAITGFTLLFTLPITLSQILREPDKANVCPASQSGEMVADKLIDGILVRSGPSIFARQFDGQISKQTRLAGCGGKGGCEGPYLELEKSIGQPVHADFCGTSLIRVGVSGKLVYRATPPSQESLNKTNTGRKIFSYGVILVLLAAIAWGVAGIRRKRLMG